MSAKQINALFAITNELNTKIEALEAANEELKNRVEQLEKGGSNQAAVAEHPRKNPFDTDQLPSKSIFGSTANPKN